ncbi:hypothetical protein HHK36_017278 [Tetracentron sinense]|uniref:NAD(+) kinase n=1 Tax=Tetracentron sinense TaxID=13715 RepID=A0A834Z467_TETSI|nr:hypothetical protein HHK36_017278 [Tetracentron sinense]
MSISQFTISPLELTSQASCGQENSSVMSSQMENGSLDSLSLLDPEKAVQELLLQPLVKGVDDHFIEFSEALRTVAKVLRKIAEGKASAQVEAAEWKRKYELESGEKNGQHKHDIVSFERGNITTAKRSSKQISLKWEQPPRTVLILTKPNSISVRILCAEMVRWLKEQKKIDIFVEPRVRTELLTESSYFNFVQTWKDDEEVLFLHTKVDLVVTLGGDGTVLWAASMFKGPVPPVVPFSLGSLGFMTPFQSGLYREYLDAILRGPISITLRHRLQCHVIREGAKDELETEEHILVLNEVTIDRGISSFLTNLECYCDNSFVTRVQGDGLILSTTSGSTAYSLAAGGSMAASMFKGPVPPVVPFSLGSLGFMTPFQSGLYREYLDAILRGPISITLRHRLQCHVIREGAKDELETEEHILVLNEVTIDRGISSFLTNLECYCDNSFVTRVQGDGLILSTTSGSTAYSLAAGGSMVPGILFTPICPHSLSFRPLILPEYVTLRIQVPFNSRGHAWASFDGKDRKKLAAGDMLVCSMAPWPVPTACQVDSTNDFLHSIHDGLHWNLRKSQSFDSPQES